MDFSLDIHCFLKDRLFIFEDVREPVLEVSRAPFGCSWGSLGGHLGPLWRLKIEPKITLGALDGFS